MFLENMSMFLKNVNTFLPRHPHVFWGLCKRHWNMRLALFWFVELCWFLGVFMRDLFFNFKEWCHTLFYNLFVLFVCFSSFFMKRWNVFVSDFLKYDKEIGKLVTFDRNIALLANGLNESSRGTFTPTIVIYQRENIFFFIRMKPMDGGVFANHVSCFLA